MSVSPSGGRGVREMGEPRVCSWALAVARGAWAAALGHAPRDQVNTTQHSHAGLAACCEPKAGGGGAACLTPSSPRVAFR